MVEHRTGSRGNDGCYGNGGRVVSRRRGPCCASMTATTMAQQNGVADISTLTASEHGIDGRPKATKSMFCAFLPFVAAFDGLTAPDTDPAKPSLHLETPFHQSANPPFPSPSSSFVPPPDMADIKLNPPPARNGQSPSSTSIFLPSSPLTPEPAEYTSVSPPSTPKQSHSLVDSASNPATPQAPYYPTHNKALSLSSSRRAPPSPSMSRRTSEASKRYSSVSAASSRHRTSFLSSFIPSSNGTTASSAKRQLSIKVKDYAFPSSDDRHLGKGPDAPRPNRQNSRLSVSSSSSSTSGSKSRPHSGWGAFKWASAGSRLWGFGFGLGTSNSEDNSDVSRPTQSDFERNFDMSSPVESENPQNSYDDDESDDYESELEGADSVPLLPGLYRAIYPFSPEGQSEMPLEEGQIVRVVGRGGGLGWAVALREDTDNCKGDDKHALVPESYLEVVTLDGLNRDND